MDIAYLVYLYAIVVGLVAAGIMGSIWSLATGEELRFGLLLEPSFLAPVRALVVVACAPLLLLLAARRHVGSAVVGLLMIAASLGWSFLQGVFILTQFFGVT
jgi:hypothetical protein